MDFYEYNETIQQWVDQVLQSRGIDAEVTLANCNKILRYGEEHRDHKLSGFAYFYMGETYYGLNEGQSFFELMGKALSHLSQAAQWELVAKCYNYLGIAAVNRGNAPIALDYYLNGLNYCRVYNLSSLTIIFLVNIGVLDIKCQRYLEAQENLEKALQLLHAMPEEEQIYTYYFGIYIDLIKCHVMQEDMEPVPEILRKIHEEFWELGDSLDYLTTYCVETIYYHQIGDSSHRDICIDRVDELMPENMSILDIFDDLYDYALVLLDADKEESFWLLLGRLERMTKNFNIINLQLRVISLKIKYYRKYGKSAEYLQASGLYYELSELMTAETRTMANMVIGLRRNLEFVNRAKERAEQEKLVLQKKSELDPLTDMANRFRLNDYSESVFTHAYEQGQTLTVEILDIDYFKEFNDNYGHQAGDRCLVRVAGVIKQLVKENHGFCARYGGDEFVIIYEGKSFEQAVALSAELKQRIMALELEHKYSKALPIVTISQGVCCAVPVNANRMWDFLHAADELLYRTKRFTRNNYCVGDLKGQEKVVMGTLEQD